jgi:hypothetical protein
VLPLFLLEAVLCLLLFIVAIVFIAKQRFAVGLYFILSGVLVPTFTIGSAVAAKHFEIGAYRIAPIQPFPIK